MKSISHLRCIFSSFLKMYLVNFLISNVFTCPFISLNIGGTFILYSVFATFNIYCIVDLLLLFVTSANFPSFFLVSPCLGMFSMIPCLLKLYPWDPLRPSLRTCYLVSICIGYSRYLESVLHQDQCLKIPGTKSFLYHTDLVNSNPKSI